MSSYKPLYTYIPVESVAVPSLATCVGFVVAFSEKWAANLWSIPAAEVRISPVYVEIGS